MKSDRSRKLFFKETICANVSSFHRTPPQNQTMMKTKILITTLLLGLSFGTVFSQRFNKPKLDSLMDILAEKNNAMGSLTISRNGVVVYSRAIGYSYMAANE